MPQPKKVRLCKDGTGGSDPKKAKKTWISVEITRVLLSPQQAVLSCCNYIGRSIALYGFQCDGVATGCESIGVGNGVSGPSS